MRRYRRAVSAAHGVPAGVGLPLPGNAPAHIAVHGQREGLPAGLWMTPARMGAACPDCPITRAARSK